MVEYYYHKIIDTKNPKQGIIELRYIDPTKIMKVRQLKKQKLQPKTSIEVLEKTDEYYVYNEKGLASSGIGTGTGIKIAADAIAYMCIWFVRWKLW